MAQFSTDIYTRSKSLGDYLNEEQDREFDNQYKMAKIKSAKAEQDEFNTKQAGEEYAIQELMKRGMSRDQAAYEILNAKSGGFGFDPNTGETYQKPKLSDILGVGGNIQAVPPPSIGQSFSNEQYADDSMGVPMPNTELTADQVDQLGRQFEAQNAPPSKSPMPLSGQSQKPVPRNPKEAALMRQKEIEGYYREPSEGERNASTFAQRLETSGEQIDNLEKDMVTYKGVGAGLPNMFQSSNAQVFNQAKRDFINAQLRRESGASISPSEFENANKQYFPQVGDRPDVIERKRQNRAIVITGMKKNAGKAYSEPVKAPKSENDPLGLFE